jgi:hypothetical protein
MKNFSSISSHSVFLSNAFRAACSQSLQKCHLKAAKQSKAKQSKAKQSKAKQSKANATNDEALTFQSYTHIKHG